MIEEKLAQYGVLGLWTIFNIALIWYYIKKDEKRDNEAKVSQERWAQIVENNTMALAKNSEVMRKCPYPKSQG